MGLLEIIAIIVFTVSLSSVLLYVQQIQTHAINRVEMFKSEIFGYLIFVSSLPFLIASGVFLGMYSWVLLVALFVGTAVVFPLFGRYVVLRLWLLPCILLDRWARKRERD